MEMEGSGSESQLPGFRFHPTEEELLGFYLRRAASGKKLNYDIISTVNLYLYEPWDLPALAKIGEREWYFFVPRDRRQLNGGRLNRTTERGFWKATGSDRPIRNASDPRRIAGFKKTLVYYRGRAPRSTKTDWVMNEYRLPDLSNSATTPPHPKEDIVLCKVYRKATSLKEMEQRAAMPDDRPLAAAAETGSTSSGSGQENSHQWTYDELVKEIMEDEEVEAPVQAAEESSSSASWEPNALTFLPDPPTARLPPALPEASRQPPKLPALQVPSHSSFDWMQDPFITQLRSPWLEQWSPLYAQLLNF